MRSVYPDFVSCRKSAVALLEDFPEPDNALSASEEIQGFDDIEMFLTDYVVDDATEEQFQEQEVAEILATTWKQRRTEISKLQQQRKFSDAKDLKRSFRVEIEELKKKIGCNRCGAIGHWARECRQKKDFNKPGNASSGSSAAPAKQTGAGMVVAVQDDDDRDIHFVASVGIFPTMVEQLRNKLSVDVPQVTPEEVLLVSSPGYGVLDSGCGKTIIGESTLAKFSDLWSAAGVKLPQSKYEVNQFRFGNGQVETSHTVVDLPIGLAGKRGILQAAVVKGTAPLLVSRPALKRLGASIDFSQDRLSLFHDKAQVPLKVNAAGQYVVDVMQFPSEPFAHDPPSAVLTADVPEALPSSSALDETVPVKPDNPIVHPDKPDSPPEVLSVDKPDHSCDSGAISASKKSGGLSRKQFRQLKSQVKKGVKPLGTKYAVIEVFSPPRATAQVEKMGLRGLALDIKQGWDLSCPKTQ
eukprot:s443_g6.t1